MADIRKSVVKKSITRKLSTAPYETLDVHVEITEEIEWDTVEKRMEKTDKITKILMMDFLKTQNKALEELKLDEKLNNINKK